MTTTMRRAGDLTWSHESGQWETTNQKAAQEARGLVVKALVDIQRGKKFSNPSRSENKCRSWGQYLYKLTRARHLGKRPFHCHIKNDQEEVPPSAATLKELVRELLTVFDDKRAAHAAAIQMLANGF